KVDLGDPGRMCEHDLQPAIGLRAPEARLHREWPADRAVFRQKPGPAGVDQERLAVVAEAELLAEVRALDGRVTDHARAFPPPAPAPSHRPRRNRTGPGSGCRSTSAGSAPAARPLALSVATLAPG